MKVSDWLLALIGHLSGLVWFCGMCVYVRKFNEEFSEEGRGNLDSHYKLTV